MTSQIDATKPVQGNATTESVRQQLAIARDEISALQAQMARALALGGGARPWPVAPLSTSRVSLHPLVCDSLTTLAAVANRIYAVPFVLGCDLTIDALSLNQTTSTANTIYAGIATDEVVAGAHQPGVVTAAAGSLTTSGSGEKLILFDDFAIAAGVPYWLLFGSSAAPSFRAAPSQAHASQFGFPDHAPSPMSFLYRAFATSLQNTCDLAGWTQAAGSVHTCLARPAAP